ncbi:MAG: HAD family phosphatase [Hafnia sp.]|uniref:HAD family hydrolase n=1 Tax=Hafnia sp. TaxID=1873498 RepID=UPI002FC7431C
MNKIKGVIFDMDGVLIDAKEWHYDALNQALALFGLTITQAEHEGVFDGLPTRDKLNRLTEHRGLPPELHSFINEMKQRYTLDLIHQNCWPVYQHQYALAKLKRTGYRLGVASNSVRGSIETMLSRACLSPYLEFTLSNEDVVCGKPDPEIYLRAQQCLGLKPHECVIVEDNPHGIAAAHASGANVLVVKDPSEVTWARIRDFIAQCEVVV